LVALAEGLLDTIPVEKVAALCDALPSWLEEHAPELLSLPDQAAPLTDDQRARLKTGLTSLARQIAPGP